MFKHTNTGQNVIVIYDSQNKDYVLHPGQSVIIDQRCGGAKMIVEQIEKKSKSEGAKKSKNIKIDEEEIL